MSVWLMWIAMGVRAVWICLHCYGGYSWCIAQTWLLQRGSEKGVRSDCMHAWSCRGMGSQCTCTWLQELVMDKHNVVRASSKMRVGSIGAQNCKNSNGHECCYSRTQVYLQEFVQWLCWVLRGCFQQVWLEWPEEGQRKCLVSHGAIIFEDKICDPQLWKLEETTVAILVLL
jgi:hypothetical protein